MKLLTLMVSLLILWVATSLPHVNPLPVGQLKSYDQTIKAEQVSEFVHTPKTVKWSYTICGDSRLKTDHTMLLISRDEALHYASKFWSGHDLEIAVALTVKEGQRDLNCVADEMLSYKGRTMYGANTSDGRHWGDSVGIFSYRTIIEQTGKGGCDDRSWQLGNTERQMGCAFQRYQSRGNTFKAWSMFTNGGYKTAIGK